LKDLTTNDFEGRRLKREGRLAVLFTASWCPFCMRFSPIFEKGLQGTALEAGRVDLSDLSNPLWETFGIEVVPTIVLFNDGKEIWRRDGILGRGLSKEAVDELIGKSGYPTG